MSPFSPNLPLLQDPFGPLRDKITVTIGTEDYELPGGFICVAGSTGSLVYRTLIGSADQTETIAAAGDSINVAGIPVVLVAVRGASTVTSIVIGIL